MKTKENVNTRKSENYLLRKQTNFSSSRKQMIKNVEKINCFESCVDFLILHAIFLEEIQENELYLFRIIYK